MKYRWSIAPPQSALAESLSASLQITPLFAQCLLNRGFNTPDSISRFLQPKLKKLADPFLLPNMQTAVDRLFQALETDEPLVIFGDYDVDGVTSTAMLIEVLRSLGWTANYYLPNRIDEGYGLSRDAVENCLRKYPVKLMLAVDCGSTAVETIVALRERGVEVIVLDHHQVANPPPVAFALVNPQLNPAAEAGEDRQDFHELCSAGLAFKLAHALVKQGRLRNLQAAIDFDVRPMLDLVAIGTIGDLVPIVGENRIMVSAGLERMNPPLRSGIKALKEVSSITNTIGVYEVGFLLGPRLNAAGRIEDAVEALHLLMARDMEDALPIAQSLDARNRERQQIERRIAEEVIAVVQARFNPDEDYVIVEGRADWHLGVVGIVASRVLQQFYRTTIILGGDGEVWRGSGRSVAGFDLAAALRECGDLLIRHGGHAMAAGVTIQPDKLDEFRRRLNDRARRMLKPEQLQPELRLDAEVTLRQLTVEALGSLSQLEPVGQANPRTQFCVRNVCHQRPLIRIGQDKQHVKMWVSDGSMSLEAVWWGAGDSEVPEGRFDLAFVPQINQYNGMQTPQLKVLDWRKAG